jgi:predicted MFS family arabinose efflux permease
MAADHGATPEAGQGAAPEGSPSPWAPLRASVFRALWIAVLLSNVGTWMQTVGAQWLLVSAPGASVLVSLVQTASSLPVLLFALPAGVFAEFLDKRRVLLATQLFQVVVGAVLTVITAVGGMSPSLLLVLTFLLGAGAAVQLPAYQAVIPELVPRAQLASAAALGSISINLARAVGPAIAGLIISWIGVAAVFALNAVTFLVFAVVLLWWRPEPADRPHPEDFLSALRVGGRYVRHAPVVRRLMLRLVLFIVPASVLWALLPLIADRRLGIGSGGYGLLLASVGAGSLIGAVLLPRLRRAWSPTGLLAVASVSYAAAMLAVGLVRIPWLVVLVLLPTGVAWIIMLSSLNATVQAFLPRWVRARGLSIYQVVLFGATAGGSALWGLVANRVGLPVSFLLSAALLAAGAASGRLLPLHDVSGVDRAEAPVWVDPQLALNPEDSPGPVLVSVEYAVREELFDQLMAGLVAVRRTRLRTGATSWRAYRDAERRELVVEQFTVPSWDEHLRQHSGGRITGADQENLDRVRELSDPAPSVRHLFSA